MGIKKDAILIVSSILVFGMINGCGGGSDVVSDVDTSTPPVYTLSDAQQAVIADKGTPEYLTISLNSDSGIREESWTYAAEQSESAITYSFWGGRQVIYEEVSINNEYHRLPSSVEPTLFTKDTKESHIIALFGNDYTVNDQSEGALDFKSWYYIELGIVVSFSEGNLVVVQTLDKPEI